MKLKINIKFFTFLLFILTIFSFALFKANKEAFAGDYSGVLRNKMTITVLKNKYSSASVRVVEARLVIKSGSLHETDEQQGHAHIVEHMAFNSTRDYPNQQLFEQLKKRGISFIQHSNAATYFDHTTYWLRLEDPTDSDIAFAIDLLTQWARYIRFPPDVLASEIPIVREEWRLREDNDARWQALYRNSRYAERYPIGTLESIESAKPSTLRAYYQRWYRPDNAAIIVTGDISSTSKIIEMIKEKFSDWAPQLSGSPGVYNINIDTLPETLIINDKHTHEESVSFDHFSRMARPTTHDKLYRAALWQAGLKILRRRLNHRLQATEGAVGNFYTQWRQESPEVLRVSLKAILSSGNFETATRILAEERAQLLSQGITQIELDNWRTAYLAEQRVKWDSAHSLADAAMHNFLYGVPIVRARQWYSLIEEQLANVRIEDIDNAVSQVMDSHPHVLLVHADRPDPTEQAHVERWLSVDKTRFSAAQVPIQASEDWSISPAVKGSIVGTRVLPGGVTEWTLSNGIVVWHQYSGGSPGRVHYSLAGAGGLNRLSEAQTLHARLALDTIAASGLRDKNAAEFNDWLNNHNAGLQPYFAYFNRGINGSGKSEDIDTLLRLLHIALTEARIDSTAWRHYKAKNRADLERFLRNPAKPWQDALGVELFNRDAALRVMTLDELNSIDMQAVSTVYQRYFKGAQNYRIAIVGDILEPTLRPAVLRSLATLPVVTNMIEKDSVRFFPRPKNNADIRVSGSGQKEASVMLRYEIEKPALPDMNSDKMDFIRLWLQGVLLTEIREQRSLVYAINTTIDGAASEQDVYTLIIRFACDPGNVDEIIDTIDILLRKLAKTTPEPTQLAQWKKNQLNRLKRLYKNPAIVAQEVASTTITGFTPRYIFNIAARTVAPAPDALQRVLQVLVGKRSAQSRFIWLP